MNFQPPSAGNGGASGGGGEGGGIAGGKGGGAATITVACVGAVTESTVAPIASENAKTVVFAIVIAASSKVGKLSSPLPASRLVVSTIVTLTLIELL